MIGYFRRRSCTRFRPYNRFLIFLPVVWDIWSLFQGFVDLGQICQAQPRRKVFVFDWVRWACSVWENFCWNLLAFWLWLFLLNLRRFDCQIFLKGGSCWLSVWTELFPVSVLNFSRRAALSAAKYLLMSVFKSVSRSYFWCLPGSPTIFLPICLLSDAFSVKTYQIFFWSFSTLNLFQDCISAGTYKYRYW